MIYRYRKFISFGFVGVIQNLLGFVAYLILVSLSISPQVAVLILYPLGALISLYGNRRFTFRNSADKNFIIKFSSIYFLGLLINLSIIQIFVSYYGYDYRLIQLIAMLLIAAGIYFSLNKFIKYN
tara:strand:- start:1350 stop:1724 length:375 start_codon:yes stop_codon:yes gene_type:complete